MATKKKARKSTKRAAKKSGMSKRDRGYYEKRIKQLEAEVKREKRAAAAKELGVTIGVLRERLKRAKGK